MGFGDITLGIKEQLGPLPKEFDLSVILAVSLPIGASRVSSHGYDPFIKLPWSKELKGGWSTGGMQSLFFNTDGCKRNAVWDPTFYIEREITKPWQAFAEYAGDFVQRSGPKEIAHLWALVHAHRAATGGFSLRVRRLPLGAEPFLCDGLFDPHR